LSAEKAIEVIELMQIQNLYKNDNLSLKEGSLYGLIGGQE
jgi:hypothetical protein